MRYALLSYRGEDTTDCHGESMNPKHQITATPGRPQASYGLADSLQAGRHPTGWQASYGCCQPGPLASCGAGTAVTSA